jgi:Rrf2 family nitric oxide-sensitive transcriptional repressor
MQLTKFTDLGLRVLMYLTQKEASRVVTINEMTEALNVSKPNLVKVVHFLAKNGWLITTRGKGGGLKLAKEATEYRLGAAIRLLEQSFVLVDCAHPPCPLQQGCELKGILNQAMSAFFAELDRHTLADLIKNETEKSIQHLHTIMIKNLS